MQPSHPSAAQLLYDLGLEANDSQVSKTGSAHTMDIVHYLPLPHVLVDKQKWSIPTRCLHALLLLRSTAQPWQWAAAVAQTFIPTSDTLPNVDNVMCCWAKITALTIANENNISQQHGNDIHVAQSLS
jgi:hypothetical protein